MCDQDGHDQKLADQTVRVEQFEDKIRDGRLKRVWA